MDLTHLENILGKLSEPLLVIGPDQRVLLANEKARRFFQTNPEGQHLLAFMRQPEVLTAVQAVLGGAKTAEAKYTSRRNVDSVYRVDVSALGRQDCGMDGAFAIFTDITQIEFADQIRSDFVANVSHELRSPLTALTGFIETLQGPASNDADARGNFLNIMQSEAERMRRLIDDLLSLSRVEVNERVRPTAPVDVIGLLKSVRAGLAPVAAGLNVGVSLKSDSAKAMVPGDADQLTQVFQNLIENAIKYGGGTDTGIAVSEIAKVVGVLGPALKIDICDSGPGIEPVHIPRLTERFYRVDSHRARAVGGTGLGLAIVKHIVSRHRGRLLITSQKGTGSVFSVILPKT